jgi:hypothetical protein
LGDFLVNTLEHFNTEHEAILYLIESHLLSPEDGKALIRAWWALPPATRMSLEMDADQMDGFISKAIP